MKTDAAWLKSLMNGSTSNDTEAMQLLQAIMPQKIIAKIQVDSELNPAWQIEDQEQMHIWQCCRSSYALCPSAMIDNNRIE